jgi:ribosomal protein S18 acetylase RimI-like enzyme
MKIPALTGNHDRNGFDCGVEALNLWLRQTALQHQAKGISRTFVAVPSSAGEVGGYLSAGYGDIGEASILGYFALASAFVLADDLAPELAKRYPRQIPITRLGRLAIRSDLQGQGLGRLLLADAVTRSRNAALSVDSAGIFVDAKNADAVQFYTGYGFIACKEQPLKLYLPMW